MPFTFFVLSTTFFMLVVVVLGSIISGIIIDAFGANRETLDARLEDLENVCFVSEKTRDQYQAMGLDFDEFREEDQQMHNYLYFMIHIWAKKACGRKDNFTGQEMFVDSLLFGTPPSTKFFPCERSSRLEDAKKNKLRKGDERNAGADELSGDITDPVAMHINTKMEKLQAFMRNDLDALKDQLKQSLEMGGTSSFTNTLLAGGTADFEVMWNRVGM